MRSILKAMCTFFQFGELGGFAAIQAKLRSEDIELGVS